MVLKSDCLERDKEERQRCARFINDTLPLKKSIVKQRRPSNARPYPSRAEGNNEANAEFRHDRKEVEYQPCEEIGKEGGHGFPMVSPPN
jgi:hypothetical protein